MSGLKILITGGFGYLGGRLGKYLVERDYEVLLGTRHLCDSPSWLPTASVVQTRWNVQDDLDRACEDVDIIIHAAGMNAGDCSADPIAALQFNGVCTAKLLDAAIRKQVRRFIYLSTAHVYRNPLIGLVTEESCTTNLHPYATSHRAGEDVVLNAHQNKAIEGIVLRLSNAFGSPIHHHANCWMLLVNDLCQQSVSTRKMILHSSGLQRRDFVTFSDVFRVVDYMLGLSIQALEKSAFNVGGQWTPTVFEMACLIQQRCKIILGFEPELTRVLPDDEEKSEAFEYRMDALKKAGFNFNSANSVEAEIDQLLMFCKDSIECSRKVTV